MYTQVGFCAAKTKLPKQMPGCRKLHKRVQNLKAGLENKKAKVKLED
jgi:hypothetical protein